jgi:hypothetical protein
LATIGGAVAENSLIGFDVHCADNDGAGRKTKLAWASPNDDGWGNPSVFGTLKLGVAQVTSIKSAGVRKGSAGLSGTRHCTRQLNQTLLAIPGVGSDHGTLCLFDSKGRRFSAAQIKPSVFDVGLLKSGTYIAVYTATNGAVVSNPVFVF